MTEDEELRRLAVLIVAKKFEDSMEAQVPCYRELAERADKIRTRLCAKLDDRRLELLEELLTLLDQMEYERELYYAKRGLKQGLEWAGRIENRGERILFS